ncbi:myrosinase 1-like isoform X1 [Neodiprion virginianus]|uniref:myrosinase 1-like isoform X1 n=2 Tax=Neodiprion virginianus TaxID=2961670 RepID=UPI001EE6C9BD|nr:myrosinase 1-like isoform X1 [Neodiprion virginianus]
MLEKKVENWLATVRGGKIKPCGKVINRKMENFNLVMRSILFIGVNIIVISRTSAEEMENLILPENLKIGAGSSAYQVEGAWNVSGKGVSNWDWWTHHCPECILDHQNGDIACDSYHKYKEDVALMKNIGIQYYRFSISWARILPTGFLNNVSEAGLQYYRNLIDELLYNGIEPIITLHHFDHPQILEFMGGWTNELMIKWYVDYARIIFQELGPKVKIFTTINEPQIVCAGYNGTVFSPGDTIPDYVGYYLCIHNILKAHATTYHMYNDEFRPYQHGRIGLNNICDGYYPDTPNDTAYAERAFQFICGLLAHPIYIGDYPSVVKERVAHVSKALGYPESRLPTFSPDWISYIKGTADFFALNHYSSQIVAPDTDEARGIYNTDMGVTMSYRESWPTGYLCYVKVVPEGFRMVLQQIKTYYNNPEIMVTEIGFPDRGELNDYSRIKYHRSYMQEMIKAINYDGCRVSRYTVWSLIDNFQLDAGYVAKFGLVKVNFDSPNRERTPKSSAYWFQKVIQTGILQDIPRYMQTEPEAESRECLDR